MSVCSLYIFPIHFFTSISICRNICVRILFMYHPQVCYLFVYLLSMSIPACRNADIALVVRYFHKDKKLSRLSTEQTEDC